MCITKNKKVMFISIFICIRPSKPNHYQQTIFILHVKSKSILDAYMSSILYYANTIHAAGWELSELRVYEV